MTAAAAGTDAREAIALDVHAHLIPPVAIAGIDGVERTADGLLRVDGELLTTPDVYRPDALLAWMDRHRVARAWVSVPPTLYRQALEAEAAGRWTRALNQALASTVATHAPRLAPLLHLPSRHPEAAASIAAEAIGQGHHRFAMPAGAAADPIVYSDARYDALWSVLSAARSFVFLHPCRGCDARLDRFHLHNTLGGPAETALAAVHLALAGVPERHPGIRFCLAHAGGATAAVAGRIERGIATGRAGETPPGARLRDRLRAFCVDCIAHDADALSLAAAIHGEDRVLFGSDWPFAMGLPEPHAQLADVAPALRRRILADNATALLAGPAPTGSPD